uniref:Anti-proliferative protein domain-containing protein n=1 Tax=Acrobeloides nanus TaxID=290746 RepID=A0A914D095_9BILA
MHFRLPRHKVCLYAEQLGNALVLCYHNLWILNGPKKEEDARMLYMKFDGKTSDIFLVAARDIGLEPNEVLFCLP